MKETKKKKKNQQKNEKPCALICNIILLGSWSATHTHMQDSKDLCKGTTHHAMAVRVVHDNDDEHMFFFSRTPHIITRHTHTHTACSRQHTRNITYII